MIYPSDVLTGAMIGGALVWFWPRKVKAPPSNVTPSCGCIMCDLKLPRTRVEFGTPFHQTQHGPVPCSRS